MKINDEKYSYAEHWKARAEMAEAELAALKAQVQQPVPPLLMTDDFIWHSDEIMAVNADIDLQMDGLGRICRAVEREVRRQFGVEGE